MNHKEWIVKRRYVFSLKKYFNYIYHSNSSYEVLSSTHMQINHDLEQRVFDMASIENCGDTKNYELNFEKW